MFKVSSGVYAPRSQLPEYATFFPAYFSSLFAQRRRARSAHKNWTHGPGITHEPPRYVTHCLRGGVSFALVRLRLSSSQHSPLSVYVISVQLGFKGVAAVPRMLMLHCLSLLSSLRLGGDVQITTNCSSLILIRLTYVKRTP